LGWGCGIPEPLGICVAGYPDIHPYVLSLCGPPLDAVAGYPDGPSTGRGIPGPFHIEVWGRAQTGRKPGDIYAQVSRATRTPSHAWMRATRSMYGGVDAIRER